MISPDYLSYVFREGVAIAAEAHDPVVKLIRHLRESGVNPSISANWLQLIQGTDRVLYGEASLTPRHTEIRCRIVLSRNG
jgi:hypothetical protein